MVSTTTFIQFIRPNRLVGWDVDLDVFMHVYELRSITGAEVFDLFMWFDEFEYKRAVSRSHAFIDSNKGCLGYEAAESGCEKVPMGMI